MNAHQSALAFSPFIARMGIYM